MASSINVYAGKNALKKIQKDGIHPAQFDVMAGASGGPKWFTLFGLDCYLFGDFFANRKDPLYTIGSSAGAWRMACFAQQDPVAAIKRLAHHYSRETYSADVDVNEISDKAILMLDKVLGANGKKEIANNPIIQSHFIVAKAKGLNRSDNKKVQIAGLLTAAATNYLSRKNLSRHFERYIFYTHKHTSSKAFFQLNDMPTKFIPADEKNIHKVLIASGSIPLVLRGVEDISGTPAGVYRDGGIIDYHLDLNFTTEKLVLYPHFFPIIKPGWFDKNIKRRNAKSDNYKNVVMITPSQEHVDSLPYKKISDRTDFQTLSDKERIDYWKKVLIASHKMAKDFKLMVTKGKDLNKIIPIESIL